MPTRFPDPAGFSRLRRLASSRLVRFGFVGGVVTIFFMALNQLIARGLGWGAQAAFLASYPPALALHFTLNKYWTFKDRRATSARHIGDYLFSVVATFLIQWPAFTALQGIFHVPGWAAAGGANVIQMTASYLLLKRRVFGAEQSAEASGAASSWHRLVLLLTVVSVSALFAWTSLGKWELPEIGPPQRDYFNLLVSGFRKGSLALDAEVPEALKASKDPYDPAKRPAMGIAHDISYYKGRYFIYFGVVPVVTLFWPFRALTGWDLSMTCAAVVYGVGAFWIVAWLWLRVLREHFPRASLLTKVGGLMAAGFAGGQLALVRRTSFWEIPIAGGYFYIVCLAAGAFLALRSRRPRPWLALAGLSLGLAVGCRPTLVAAGGGLAWVVSVIAWRSDPQGLRASRTRRVALAVLAAGIPLGAVIAGLLAYNAARFGDPLEFGFNYQLTANGYEDRLRHFSAAFAPFNLRAYFWSAPQWGRYFPFIHPIRYTARPAGYYGLEYVYGALVVCPLIWLCGLFPGWVARRGSGDGLAFALFFLAASLGATAVIVCFNSAAGRYVADFLPLWVWLALLTWAALERELEVRKLHRTAASLGAAFGACALYSCGLAFFQSADIHGILNFENPAAYDRISRWFDMPAAAWERLSGQPLGALEMDLVFPDTPSGSNEPLVVTGVEYQMDYVFVHFRTPRLVQLGYLASGTTPLFGDEIAIEPGRSYHLRIEEGSLLPPEGHPAYEGWTAAEIRSVTRWVTITVDGRPVLTRSAESHPSSPGFLQIGRDRKSSVLGKQFGGVITNVHRDPLRRPQNGDKGTGDVSLELTFPTEPDAQVQPIAVLGKTGQADLIGLRMADSEHFRIYYESWGGGTVESGPIVVPRTRTASLRLRLGAMYRGDRGPASAAIGGAIVAWLDGAPIWWTRELRELAPDPTLDIAVNAIGSSAMIPFFKGRVDGWTRGPAPSAWRPGRFGALELDLAGRGSGSEPLAATGQPGVADTLAIQWLSEGQARLLYDHWGTGAVFSPPFEWGASRIHTLRIEMPSFSHLDLPPSADSRTGRLVATLDGRTIWEDRVPFNGARSDTLSIGRNIAGSTIAELQLSSVVVDVRQADLTESSVDK